MDMQVADEEWPEGWCGLAEGQADAFLAQLRRELPNDHPFQHMEISTIGTAEGSDDVIYAVSGWIAPFFLCHLAWPHPDTRPWLIRKLKPRAKWSPSVQPIFSLCELAHYFD